MQSFEKTFRSQTKSDLKVSYKSENLGIKIEGRNQEETDFYVKFDYKKNDEDIVIEDMIQTKYDRENNVLEIDVTNLENKLSIRHSEFVLSIPIISEVSLKIENGPVSAENLQGKQKISSENAPIKMDRINGEIECETENSPITVLACNSDINVNTANGPINMKDCRGRLDLNTENSPIKITKCKGNLVSKTENGPIRILDAGFEKADIQSENGSIYYEFLPIESGKFNFENENGKIHLIVPDGIPYKIRAENELGNFNIGLEGNYDRRTEDDIHIIEMTKSSGNVEINARNENGSIRIMKNPHHEKSFGEGFNIDLSGITDGIDLGKIEIELDKAKQFIEKIKTPDINEKVRSAMNKLKTEIDENKLNDMNLPESVQNKINSVMEKIVQKFENIPLNEKQQQEVDERSRLKILQMLQDGTITADETERLLKAMEK